MMNYKNLSVNYKIALAFTCIAVAVIGLGIYLVSELQKTRDNLLFFADDVLPSVLLVEKIKAAPITIREMQFLFLSNIDDPNLSRWQQENRKITNDVNKMLDIYEPTIITREEQQSFDRVSQAWGNYLNSQSGFDEQLRRRQLASANQILLDSYHEFEQLQQALADLTQINTAFTVQARTDTLDGVSEATTMTYAGITALLMLMGFLTFLLGRQILAPLHEVMAMAKAIATGNLAYELKREQIGNDELGQLADSCISMQNNLRVLVEEIGAAVVQLSASIEEVSAISEQSSQGMSQQQNEITMVATAMQQMQATVNEVAMNTEDASSSANSATERAEQGSKEVQLSIGEIQQVSEVIENAGQMVAQLEQDSTSISMVVDVIGSIAEQTNLLALNAAIEAARAGEQGRGFAVVADEVRTLAGRTQDSTRQIVEIIEKLQLRAVEAGTATKQSCEMIRNCVEQTHSTGEKISEIEQAVTQIAAMNIQIASACSEQNSVTEDLNRSVETINVSSSEAAIGASQTAQACIELSQLSLGLKTMVEKFKTT